jgi:hypothetical protein
MTVDKERRSNLWQLNHFTRATLLTGLSSAAISIYLLILAAPYGSEVILITPNCDGRRLRLTTKGDS